MERRHQHLDAVALDDPDAVEQMLLWQLLSPGGPRGVPPLRWSMSS